MTVAGATDTTPARRRRFRGGRVLQGGAVIYWWAEILFVAVFYAVYSTIRNVNGNDTGEAKRNAITLIGWQKTLGINHERTLQEWALHVKPLIIACNYFYGSLHFAVTAGTLIFLFRKDSDDYPLWRNTLAIATALALIGFAFFPLMPPRLLDHYGLHTGFVDTLAKYPTFWTFNSGAVSKISNQYAAMPSVHCAWALFCAIVLIPRLRHLWAKVLAGLYPLATVTAIVLTANHYFLDVVGGFAVLGAGYVIARICTRAGRPGTRAPDDVSRSSPCDGAAESRSRSRSAR
jgi:PAP2 superfamily